MHGLQDGSGSLADLVSSIDALQASIKESTSLLRLDLQQHTALQVGVLTRLSQSGYNGNEGDTLVFRSVAYVYVCVCSKLAVPAAG